MSHAPANDDELYFSRADDPVVWHTFSVDPFCVDVVIDELIKLFLLRVLSYGLDLDDAATARAADTDLEL